MKIVRIAAEEFAVGEGFDALCFDEDDVVGVLDLAFDDKEVFLGNKEAGFLEESWSDDGIGNAGFVFETYKHKAFGGPGTLPADDVARNAHALAMASFG